MKQLEAVYLANVILHIRTLETIIKLIQVNKKCQEASKIIRYYEPRRESENKEEELNNKVFKYLFDLFPNIETIKGREFDIQNNLELIKKVKRIELFGYLDKIQFSNEIKDKIIRLNIICNSLKNIQLKEFPNVRKVKVDYSKIGFLKYFLGDVNLKLIQLIICCYDHNELDCLKDYTNIQHKIIKLSSKISLEIYNELKSFANVITQLPIDGVDIKDTFGLFYDGTYSKELLFISNECDIKRLNELTLITKCCIMSDCDLRNCELLEKITSFDFNRNDFSIQVEGLNHLKTIKDIKKVDCIPPSLISLTCKQEFNFKELLEKDNNCFNNIKKLKLNSTCWDDKIEDIKLLINFKNCVKINIQKVCSYCIQTFELPLGLKELIINDFLTEKQLNEIMKLTRLKKLSICFNSDNKKHQIQKMFDNMKELEWLKTVYIEDIKLPSTITFLDLDVKENTDLCNYSNLKEIRITNDSGFDIKIKLPNNLNKLFIQGNVVITNSNEIQIDKIIKENEFN